MIMNYNLTVIPIVNYDRKTGLKMANVNRYKKFQTNKDNKLT